MTDLNALQRAADQARLLNHPLPTHLLANHPEHLRHYYALLIVALLTVHGSPTEAQARLLRLLLQALGLGDCVATLFEQAREIQPDTLLEAARLVREAGCTQHLLTDALVLLRLETPLEDDLTRAVSEMADLLDLNASAISTCVTAAVAILGLESKRAASAASQWPARYPGLPVPRKPVAAAKGRSTPVRRKNTSTRKAKGTKK